ncbi:MAG: sigma-54 dependent transcriptional regulator [Verrucomicrobiae bacterium]|nr:sigma-54 dependent transcriptional regulator [Verrucomicrobiae bacterium]
MKHILAVDDEFGTRESIKAIFFKLYEVSVAANAREAMDILSKQRIDLVILDQIMPDTDGITLMRDIKAIYPEMPVILVTAVGSEKTLAQALRLGAVGYIRKPFDVDELRHTVIQSIDAAITPRAREIFQKEVNREFSMHTLVGEAPIFRKAISDARNASTEMVSVPLWITGESGTGKEFLARQIHSWSAQRSEPFIYVRCFGQPDSILEAELFGFEPQRPVQDGVTGRGAFDLAGSGTVYLDEIDQVSPATQEKIAKLLETRKFNRIGSSFSVPIGARIILASSKTADQIQSSLKPELMNLIGNKFIHLPPLRERPEDVALLAYHFLNQLRRSMYAEVKDIAPEALDLMRKYQWPGNIRELRSMMERLLVVYSQETCIREEHLPKELLAPGHRGRIDTYTNNFEETVNAFEREIIVNALTRANGNINKAASLLGTTRRIVLYRIDKLNIKKVAK